MKRAIKKWTNRASMWVLIDICNLYNFTIKMEIGEEELSYEQELEHEIEQAPEEDITEQKT